MKKVLFIGDINVDIIMGGLTTFPILNREVPCKSFDITMGSTAVITACAYASLGGSASFLGLAGEDDYGNLVLNGLKEFGVNVDLVQRTREVRTGVTVNMILGDTRTQVTYPGTIAEFDGTRVDAQAFAGFQHVHFAGPYQQTRFRPEIARLLRAAKEDGCTTSLDPQWDATERWEHMDEWLPLLDYFFANDEEALSITQAATSEEALRALALATPCPVLKAGKSGSFLCVKGEIIPMPPFSVQVADPTGAGDSFNAGVLFGLLEKQMGLPEAARFGNATGARCCTFVGGVTARSSYKDIVTFMKEHT